MSRPAWVENPLQHLLGEVPQQVFFRDYYEKAALRCHHGDAARYRDLVTLQQLDALLANSELPPDSLQLARKEPALNRADFTYANGAIDRGAVLHHFQHGATIILPQLHLSLATLAEFCRAMEVVLSAHVQTNLYLTPPDNQGFKSHFDDHDVFIIQVSGTKKWRLYQYEIQNPYRGEKFRAGDHIAGPVEDEFILNAGDCLYLPRGLMHDAEAFGEEPSLHITVGFLTKRWADLMLEAVSEVALRHPGFRRSLPPGYARADFDADVARQQFAELVATFAAQADFAEVLEMFRENFIRERGPDLPGALLAATQPIPPETRFRLRPHSLQLLRYDDDEVILVCGGGDLKFPRGALGPLQTVISGAPFTRSLFADQGDEQMKVIMIRLISFGVVERLDQENPC